MISVEGAPQVAPEQVTVAAFDIDGVLLSTTVAERSHAILAIELGLRLRPEKCRRLGEMYLSGDIWNHITEAKLKTCGNPQLEYDAMVYEGFWEETFAEIHPLVVKSFASSQYNPSGAIPLLEDLCATDIKTAAWTSRSLSVVGPIETPLVAKSEGEGPREHGWFNVFITADHVGKHELKPHPRGGTIILETLGVRKPESVIYFGDRSSDMIAARQLGMIACGIVDLSRGLQDEGVESLIESGACYLADSVADTREWFGLPAYTANQIVARERELNRSRQYYNATLEDTLKISMYIPEEERMGRMGPFGMYFRHHRGL